MPVPSPLSRHHNSQPDIRANDSTDKPLRPPPRPNNPALELEPNPFEASFSSSSQALNTRNNSASHRHSPSSEDKKPYSTSSSPTLGSGSDHSRRNSSNGSHLSGDTPKPILPPLAAITSPSDPSYSWQFPSGLSNSLRSGPLSPAMLAGPQSHPSGSQAASSSISTSLFGFDPSGTFRTGLTPSTGLTPLVGGPVSFPLPSPNTAALIAMYNSNSAAASTATITPNTLNALTGVLSQHTGTSSQPSTNNGASGMHSSSTNGSGPSQTSSIAPSQIAASSATNASYQNGNSPTQQRYASDNNLLFTQTQLDNSSSKPYVHTPTSATSHAANGLFLLSQAHQELTKREEAQKQALTSSNVSSNESRTDNRAVANGSSSTKRGSKRKSDNASVSSSTSNKANVSKKSKPSTASNARATRRSSAAASASNAELEDEDEEDEESDDEPAQPPPPASMKSKKPETEEEKRKNFLERNRQAALKCRQRKKAWLAQLQAKVEFLTNENERLSAALVSSREEISRLSQLVGGAGVGLPVSSGVGVGVPLVGVGMNGVQHQPVHASYMAAHQQQQQQHHPISVPVSVQGGTAASPPIGVKTSPLIHTQQIQHSQHSHSPHSPSSEGRSSRSSIRDVREYGNGAGRDPGRDYARDIREREMGHVHAHAPQAVTVNGRGYGY